MRRMKEKSITDIYSPNGHRAFYIREGHKLPSEKERGTGTVRVLTLMDLFAGAGGFTLGFVQAGFTPVFAVEFDRDAAATYEANFGPHCSTESYSEVLGTL